MPDRPRLPEGWLFSTHSGVDSVPGACWRNERDPCKCGLRGEETVQSAGNPVIIATSERVRVLRYTGCDVSMTRKCSRDNKR